MCSPRAVCQALGMDPTQHVFPLMDSPSAPASWVPKRWKTYPPAHAFFLMFLGSVSSGPTSASWFIGGKFPWLKHCTLRPEPVTATLSLSLLHRLSHEVGTYGSAETCSEALRVIRGVMEHGDAPWAPTVCNIARLAAKAPETAAAWLCHIVRTSDSPRLEAAGWLLHGLAASKHCAKVPMPDQLTATWMLMGSFMRFSPQHWARFLPRLPVHLAAFALLKCVQDGDRDRSVRAVFDTAPRRWAVSLATALLKLGVYGWVAMSALPSDALAGLPSTWWYLKTVFQDGDLQDLDPINYNLSQGMYDVVRHWGWDPAKPDTCCVCYDDGDQEPWVSLPCGHSAHAGCMYDWARKSPGGYTCPYCFTEVAPRRRVSLEPVPTFFWDHDEDEDAPFDELHVIVIVRSGPIL